MPDAKKLGDTIAQLTKVFTTSGGSKSKVKGPTTEVKMFVTVKIGDTEVKQEIKVPLKEFKKSKKVKAEIEAKIKEGEVLAAA